LRASNAAVREHDFYSALPSTAAPGQTDGPKVLADMAVVEPALRRVATVKSVRGE